MHTPDKQVRSLNICQKFFNFFLHNFLSPGLKRLASGSPHSHNSSIHIPVDVHQPNPHHNEIVQPDRRIHVHFTDGEDDDRLQSWTKLDRGVGSPGFSVHIEETKEMNPGKVRKKGVGGTGTRKMDKGGDKKGKKKISSSTTNLLGEKLPLVIDPRGETELDSLMVRPHLISVASNINEKSDEFIKTRIAAMQDKH